MNLLFVIHCWVGYGPHGGTELHVRDIARELSNNGKDHVYILFPDKTESRVDSSYILLDAQDRIIQKFHLNQPISGQHYKHSEWTDVAVSIINKYQIDLLHFFHLLRFPLNFPLIAQQTGAMVVISFFDYFLICPQFYLLGNNDQFCGYPEVSLETCDLCLQQNSGYQSGSQRIRRQLISEVLYHTDAVHYLCNDQKNRMMTAYPHLKERPSLTMGLGLDRQPQAQSETTSSLNLPAEDLAGKGEMPLKVAWVGNVSSNKGSRLFMEVLDHYRTSSTLDIQFHVYGELRHPHGQTLLKMAQQDFVKIHGSYSPEQLPQLLHGCDVGLFTSVWPETFVLALSEVWSCGLVPIAPRIGAFEERITDGKNGFLFDLKDPGSLIRVLDELSGNRNELSNCLSEIKDVKYPSLKENAREYLSFYHQVVERSQDTDRMTRLSRLVMSGHPDTWGRYADRLPVLGSSIKHNLWRVRELYHHEGLNHIIYRLFKSAQFRVGQWLRKSS
jgi:glycosyltransferase involved in cell wall biosynthesis